ncbi:hypothetical protein CDAR_398201 [Caerostris darwini]|uniref:Ribosomal protein L2 n=1 Tax=Caerostris darwini TaxID=1538125 RepID=A0AAV4WS08_9ARAC|nr:hypothetical protein CDAR_398201 [Caerostris darwini]
MNFYLSLFKVGARRHNRTVGNVVTKPKKHCVYFFKKWKGRGRVPTKRFSVRPRNDARGFHIRHMGWIGSPFGSRNSTAITVGNLKG